MLLRTDWSKRADPKKFLNVGGDGPHSPGFHKTTSQLLANDRDVLGVGVETVGTDAGQAGMFDPPFPNHATMHGAGKFGLASLTQSRSAPGDRRGRHRGAAEDRERQRKSAACDRPRARITTHNHTATVSAAVIPFVTSPVTVASSSDAPSLKTLSVASVICD